MKNVVDFLGADISKKSIDLSCHSNKKHLVIENNQFGFKAMLKWLSDNKISSSTLLVVMEHTGLYSFCFESFLHQHKISFSKVNPLELKRSFGLARGKSDKIDAGRIASYAFEKKDKLRPEALVSKAVQSLKLLNASRELLVRQRASLKCSVQELRHIGLPESNLAVKSQIKVIKALDKQIHALEIEIEAVIEENESLSKNYGLLQSIIGVGKVVAYTAIIKTQNFTLFADGRKFACYCGTAPFENTSGTSLRGKTKVSHIADKRMKSLLDMAARSAINHDQEIGAFYHKRVASGKAKKSTRNIVRNKIIHRMFAVIKRQTPFLPDYRIAA